MPLFLVIFILFLHFYMLFGMKQFPLSNYDYGILSWNFEHEISLIIIELENENDCQSQSKIQTTDRTLIWCCCWMVEFSTLKYGVI